MKKTLGLFLLLVFIYTGPAAAQTERIINYHSDIHVLIDGSMTVTETIKVYSTGSQIKRGIYRTFPTKYKDRAGNTIKVAFDIIEVRKDGQSEPYHTENMSNGVKVYIGQSDVFLRPGEYTYTLIYRTNHQLGFFKEYDELYWNVTGLDWGFPIEKAEAVLHLPDGASPISKIAYTGQHGADGKNYSVSTDYRGNIWFKTTTPLPPHAGLTIAVSFNKGVIPEPTLKDKAELLLRSNNTLMAAVAGLVVLLVYYIFAWLAVGRDPERGPIVPQFKPPDGYSPAATRYVRRMGYSDRVFAAAVVNMAVKGFLNINEDKGQYTLTKTGNNEAELSRGEKLIAKKLFRSGSSIKLAQTNHRKIRAAIKSLKNDLKTNFEVMNFVQNRKYIVPGIIITLLTLGGIILTASVKPLAGFMALWLTGWTFGTLMLVMNALKAWRGALTGGSFKALKGAGAIGMTLFALPFVMGELFGLFAFATATSAGAALMFLLIIVVNIVFKDLLKAPTIMGRKIIDQIEGFRMYLKTAEEQQLKYIAMPSKTPKLYEQYLPYALALDVEHEWSEKFADVLALSGTSQGYSPAWYTGSSLGALSMSGLSSSLGSSLSSAISSSSTAPGSSSGSSGGGFSGGGGGGGGGGGW